jgi:transcription initiation factor TFIID subunit 2
MSRAAGSSAGSSAERGFTVSHQKVALELGFASTSSAVLAGYTELTIIPTDRHLRTVFLNSRQCSE